MPEKISIVINTLNEGKNIRRVLESVKWASEVVVCDMHSEDETAKIAKDLGAKVVLCKRFEYVELARNFAISKTTNQWVLIVDPDEEIETSLAERLIQIASTMKEIDYVRIARKNLIFGKWMKAAMWWPDYNIRFFRKDKIKWTDKIHRPPEALGEGIDLEAKEEYAIIHHHYLSISQFLERMIRYTKIQAEELHKGDYKFEWKDLIKKPVSEFLGRYFANKGYEDGLHGLSLSLLQAFSFFIMYLRVWEMEKFKNQQLEVGEFKELVNQSASEIEYWFKYINLSKNPFKRFVQKVKNKI